LPHRTESPILIPSRSCHVGMVTYPVTLKRDLAHEPVPFVFSGNGPSGQEPEGRRSERAVGVAGGVVATDMWGFARGREPRSMHEPAGAPSALR
jgi:hypothetical protein